ncbi:MAG: glycosyltransferase family 39 protein [Verrucomicrobiota bacterium]|jgi:membrane-associated phospholipid phosphatase
MIGWLQSVDVWLFRSINSWRGGGFIDWLMAFVSNSPWFACVLICVCLMLLCRGGARGRVCVLMLALALCLGNWMVCDALKNIVARPRPFQTLPDVMVRVGMGGSFSMPSSHAANWFSATMVLLVYYRRTVWCLLPLALLVSFSRIYNGVHYPSDVLAGAILGAGYSAAVVWGCEALWQGLGARWFPAWRARMPSLLRPAVSDGKPAGETEWLHLGCLFVALFLFIRLLYIGSGRIELSEDEAYQWLWSKHPALSYYSKPPLIALTQFLGTHLWGDNAFGVRFFSPVIAAVLSVLVLRFLAREAGARLAFIVLLIITVTPLTALGATVMTVDPLSVLFWTAAMVAGWRAVQPGGTTRQWLWAGLWMGLGFLSKYTNLFQYACWGLFFLLWPPARRHLRRPGPYLALLAGALACLPVVIWNAQHHWITAVHVASDGQLGQPWNRTYVAQFLLTEAAVLHPLFFVASLWAAMAFWRRGRGEPLQVFLFTMGVPLFLCYFLLSWHSHIEANWIAPSVIPLFCLMAIYWNKRWEQGAAAVKPLLAAGIAFGAAVVLLLYDPGLVNKVLHRKLPPRLDLLHRVRGWKELAEIAGQARADLEKQGPPAFIIADHYGFTSEISFYLPEAKSRVLTGPVVFCYASQTPRNQFYFWPGYLDRKGQNAIFIREAERPRLRPGWFSRWWHHDEDIYLQDTPPVPPLPPEVQRQFDSFTYLGLRNVVVGGDIVRRAQLFECHHLR